MKDLLVRVNENSRERLRRRARIILFLSNQPTTENDEGLCLKDRRDDRTAIEVEYQRMYTAPEFHDRRDVVAGFTRTQGRYLAFIDADTTLNGYSRDIKRLGKSPPQYCEE
jgi:hypothetical protein